MPVKGLADRESKDSSSSKIELWKVLTIVDAHEDQLTYAVVMKLVGM